MEMMYSMCLFTSFKKKKIRPALSPKTFCNDRNVLELLPSNKIATTHMYYWVFEMRNWFLHFI